MTRPDRLELALRRAQSLDLEIVRKHWPEWHWNVGCHRHWIRGEPWDGWHVSTLLSDRGDVAERWYARYGRTVSGTRANHDSLTAAIAACEAAGTPPHDGEPEPRITSRSPWSRVRWLCREIVEGHIDEKQAWELIREALSEIDRRPI